MANKRRYGGCTGPARLAQQQKEPTPLHPANTSDTVPRVLHRGRHLRATGPPLRGAPRATDADRHAGRPVDGIQDPGHGGHRHLHQWLPRGVFPNTRAGGSSLPVAAARLPQISDRHRTARPHTRRHSFHKLASTFGHHDNKIRSGAPDEKELTQWKTGVPLRCVMDPLVDEHVEDRAEDSHQEFDLLLPSMSSRAPPAPALAPLAAAPSVPQSHKDAFDDSLTEQQIEDGERELRLAVLEKLLPHQDRLNYAIEGFAAQDKAKRAKCMLSGTRPSGNAEWDKARDHGC